MPLSNRITFDEALNHPNLGKLMKDKLEILTKPVLTELLVHFIKLSTEHRSSLVSSITDEVSVAFHKKTNIKQIFRDEMIKLETRFETELHVSITITPNVLLLLLQKMKMLRWKGTSGTQQLKKLLQIN